MDVLVFLIYILAALPGIRALLGLSRGQTKGWRRGILVSLVLIVLLALAQAVLGIYADLLWFRELGAAHRYWTELEARWITDFIGALAAFVVLLINSLFIPRGSGWPPVLSVKGKDEPGGLEFRDLGDGRWALAEARSTLLHALDRLRIPIVILLSLALGGAFGSNWWTNLLYLHRQSFHRVDPQFGQDIGFYVYTLPFWNAVIYWLAGVLVVALVFTAVLRLLYLSDPAPSLRARTGPVRRGMRHIGILIGGLFLLGAARTWISRFELVYSRSGPLVGASAADVHIAAPLIQAFAVTLALLAVAAALFAPRVRRRSLAGFLAVWLGSALLEIGIIPAAYEALAVKPQQLQAELPYVKRHLQMTREAFGLDSTHVHVINLPEATELTSAAVAADSSTIRNLRLADWRPLLHTYNQLQTLRTYYRFADVDIDRYDIGGGERAVMLSLREMDESKVPAAAGSGGWDINRWFIYTHGYGLCMNSINSFSSEGIPTLLIRDLPPVSLAGVGKVTRPEIYYGELTTEPVMVRARKQQEFDYPRGDDNIFTTYEGKGGIRLGTLFSGRRLAFALRFHSAKFFLSSYIGPETRILLNRDITSRIDRLAPFLTPDGDPYVVLREDGSLVLVRDFYTTWNEYPYGTVENGVAYIRNSVKATLDCYNGTVKLYVVDEGDPLIRAYRDIYPDLFAPGSAVPADIRRHFRYPEDLLSLQAAVYGSFHVRDAVTFYNHEDVWETANEVVEGASGSAEPIPPYYAVMRLPEQKRPEFLEMLPLTPRDKDNMIAWIAGRCDPTNYGQVIAYHLPKGSIAYGPRQIEARIDQDPTISKDLSLWNQQGSQVLRGNLITIPIAGSFLYVEPLYIQATGGKIPELKRVIVATQKDVGYGTSLEEALGDLFGASVAALAPAEGGPSPAAETAGSGGFGSVETGARGAEGGGGPAGGEAASAGHGAGELGAGNISAGENPTIQSAAEHLRRYQKLMGEGRAAEAGAELDKLAKDLDALSHAGSRARP